MIKIGFVILTWNSEKVIKNCLDSIFGMKNIDVYIVIIDNGSTDNTVRIIEKAVSQNKVSIDLFINETNLGTTSTRNKGLKQLLKYDLDYFCILDSDTIINYEAFAVLCNEMAAHWEYGIIGPKMISKDGSVQMSARAFPTFFEKICKGMPIKKIQEIGEKLELQIPDDNAAVSYPVDYLMSACWLIRPIIIDKVGYLDERIFYAPEDAEYCIRVWKAGYLVAYCPQATIIHEWQRISKKKFFSRCNWEHIKGLLYMFKKHGYFFTAKKLKKNFASVNTEVIYK